MKKVPFSDVEEHQDFIHHGETWIKVGDTAMMSLDDEDPEQYPHYIDPDTLVLVEE